MLAGHGGEFGRVTAGVDPEEHAAIGTAEYRQALCGEGLQRLGAGAAQAFGEAADITRVAAPDQQAVKQPLVRSPSDRRLGLELVRGTTKEKTHDGK